MSTKPQELSKIIADLRQIIVGKVAMPTDQIEQITLFLFLKQLSRKHDDLVRIGSKELIFTGAWERYHFDVLMRHSGEELVKECREAVESLYKNPNIDATVRKVFERSYLKILEPKVLSHFLTFLNDKFSDGLDLGDFYESLLPILGTQNELGQFRTPRHIIDFIVKVVDPSIGEKIADPACGTAGFLVASYNYLKAKYTDEKGRPKLNPEQTKKLYNETIFGWDSEPLMVKFSLANLYLHGLKVPNVSENDTLINENLWQHSFDIIVANPPFITPKGGAHRHSRFAITSNKTEVLFCEWMVHHLNFNGRMGIIVPEGIIFDGSKGHQAIRKLFLDNGLWCVVTLPAQVFQPYSGVRTSIIFLDKTLKPENILFYKIENHGFSLNTNPSPIDKNDLPESAKFIKEYKEILRDNKQKAFENSKYYTVAKSKILENSLFSLNSGVYLGKIKTDSQKWPMVELGEVIEVLDSKRKPITKSDRKHGKFPYYGATGILDYVEDYIFDERLVLIGEDGAKWDAGDKTAFIAEGRYWVNNHAHVVRPIRSKIIDSYLVSFLNYLDLSAYITGVTVPKLNQEKLRSIQIPLPPIEIQEQIVAELENYQKIIDGARAVVENWKPNFEIDTKWEIKKLEDIAEVTSSKRIFKNEYVENGVPFYRTKEVVELYEGKSISLELFISEKKYQEIKNKFDVPQKGEILISAVGTIGYSWVVPDNREFYFKDGNLLWIKDIKADPYYLRLVLDSMFVSINQLSAGAAYKALTIVKLRQIEIPLPLLETQKQIVAKIEEEQKIVEANKRMIGIMENKISEVLALI